jgi:MinD superfamily P-loop ATPase
MVIGAPLEIVIASGKGGTGKSTVSSSLILYLYRKGYKIVAADADAEAPNLHLLFNVSSWDRVDEYSDAYIAEIDYSRCDMCGECVNVCPFDAIKIVDGKYFIDPTICEGCSTCSLACPRKAIRRRRVVRGRVMVGRTEYGFPIVSASIEPGRPNSGKLVTEVKNRAREIAGRESIIVLDAAAGIGCQVISAFTGASLAILVAEPTPAGLSNLIRVHEIAKHFNLPSALIINKSDLDEDYAEKIIRYAEEENIDFLGAIPYDNTVPLSMTYMKPVTEFSPDSPASKALMKIFDVVEERIIRDFDRWRRAHKPSKPSIYRPILIKPGEII